MDQRPGRGEQVHALADQELADEEDALVSVRPTAESGGDRRSVPAEGIVPLLAAQLLGLEAPGEAVDVLECLGRWMRPEAMDVHTGRADPCPCLQVRIRHRVEQDLRA